jgi:hypothetical protein
MKNRILAVLAFVIFATPAFAVANDPKAVVLDVYANLKKMDSYEPPKTIYTPRLAKLIADDTADANGEVGRLDVDMWVNGQDFQIGPVTVTSKADEYRKDRQIVTAKVTDFGKVETVVYYFEQVGGKWLIDDLRWTGKDGWTLSLVLKYGDYGPTGEK